MLSRSSRARPQARAEIARHEQIAEEIERASEPDADAALPQDEPVHFQSKAPGDNSGGSTKSLLGRPGGSPVYARRLLQPSTCGVNGWMTVNAVSSAWNSSLPQAPQLTAGRHVAADPPCEAPRSACRGFSGSAGPTSTKLNFTWNG
jgi:hypothetical protein